MRVLLVADRPGWAYDILAQSIKKYSRQEYIEIKYVFDGFGVYSLKLVSRKISAQAHNK